MADEAEVLPLCGCGDGDCWNLGWGYPWCHGCDEHHRDPVAAQGERCPVDVMIERMDLEEGIEVADRGSHVMVTDGRRLIGHDDVLRPFW